MDWKPYYRSELVTPGVRELLIGFLEEGRDPLIEEGLKRGAIVSFPHTSVHYSGPLQARLVSSLYRCGISRIIALGVLHGIGIPAFRRARDGDLSADERKGAFEEIKGGFVPEGDRFETPFEGYPTWIPEAWNGSISSGSSPPSSRLIRSYRSSVWGRICLREGRFRSFRCSSG